MYQAKKRRRSTPLVVVFLFLFAICIGIGAGYASVKLNLLPPAIHAQPDDNATPNPPVHTSVEEENAPVAMQTVVPAEPEDNMEMGFFVKTVDGDVCVFRIMSGGQNIFSHKIPVILNDLRPEDRKKLDEGIHLGTKQELLEFIEDFSS